MKRNSRSGKLCFPLALFTLVMALSLPAAGQQAAPSDNPAAPQPSEQKAAEQQAPASGAQQPSADATRQRASKPGQADKKPQNPQGSDGTSNDRLFWTLPNFLTLENAGQVPPLTAGQKFKAVARCTFDPIQFTYYSLLAGIGQAENSEQGYGQGWLGYAKRYGATFGDSTIENFMTGAVFSSLLRQDPRYFQMGKGGFGRRAWHVLTRIMVVRGDSGRSQFNASEIFGSALAAGISTYTYHPREDQKLVNVAEVWGTQIALDSVANMFKEFWPDIRRHFSRKKGTPAAGTVK